MSETFAALAEFFRYPEESPRLNDDVHGELGEFAREIAALDRRELQAAYTSTFDLAPSCSPYLGAHLFGAAGLERGRLLAGLRASYTRAGIHFDEREVPDHVAEVLAFAAHEETEEWFDLVRLILVPALTKMEALVQPTSNPYRHLIAAARQASEAALCRGGAR